MHAFFEILLFKCVSSHGSGISQPLISFCRTKIAHSRKASLGLFNEPDNEERLLFDQTDEYEREKKSKDLDNNLKFQLELLHKSAEVDTIVLDLARARGELTSFSCENASILQKLHAAQQVQYHTHEINITNFTNLTNFIANNLSTHSHYQT
jgi:hypothetical protein